MGYDCDEPLFSYISPSSFLRPCDNVAGNGELFAENSDYASGNTAVGFVVTAPEGDGPLAASINANTIFQYRWQLWGNWPLSTNCSGRLALYVTDINTGEKVAETDYYLWSASVDEVWDASLTFEETSGPQWYEIAGPDGNNGVMAAQFNATPGHRYIVWIWSTVNNSYGQGSGDGDQMSVLATSATTVWLQ